jgi:hypothetical protein
MIVRPGRVLIVTQYFCERKGGTPEAARLLACKMAEIGIVATSSAHKASFRPPTSWMDCLRTKRAKCFVRVSRFP